MTESQQLSAAQARISELEGANQQAAKTAAINSALAGHTFASPAAAAHVAKLIEPEIEMVNGVAVEGKTMRPASDAIAAKLKDPGWSHFLGGASRAAVAQPAAAPGPNPDATFEFDSNGQPRLRENERTLGEVLIRVTKARSGAGADSPIGDPSKPFGLRRRV